MHLVLKFQLVLNEIVQQLLAVEAALHVLVAHQVKLVDVHWMVLELDSQDVDHEH